MEWLTHIGTFVGGIVAVCVPAYIYIQKELVKISKERYEHEKQKKRDSIEEWQKIADRNSDEIRKHADGMAKAEAKIEMQEKTIGAMRLVHTQEIDSLRRAEAKCLAENAKNTAKIEMMQVEVIHLRAIVYAQGPAPTFATVEANMDGVIVDASDEIKAMLGYRAAELVGKPIEFIMPPKYHEQHHLGMERAKAGQEREEGKAITGEARTKHNGDIPVTVVLNYVDVEGQKRVLAELYNRRVVQESAETMHK